MQVNDLLEPNVRIRELKKDSVNFVLENVDISYVSSLSVLTVYNGILGLPILFGGS
jgi:hypothetical protein